MINGNFRRMVGAALLTVAPFLPNLSSTKAEETKDQEKSRIELILEGHKENSDLSEANELFEEFGAQFGTGCPSWDSKFIFALVPGVGYRINKNFYASFKLPITAGTKDCELTAPSPYGGNIHATMTQEFNYLLQPEVGLDWTPLHLGKVSIGLSGGAGWTFTKNTLGVHVIADGVPDPLDDRQFTVTGGGESLTLAGMVRYQAKPNLGLVARAGYRWGTVDASGDGQNVRFTLDGQRYELGMTFSFD